MSECREGCLRPLAALSFLEPRAGYRVCDLAAPALESGQSPLGCPVPMWTASFLEQLAGLPRLWFGRFITQRERL